MTSDEKIGQLLFDIVFSNDTAKETYQTLKPNEISLLFELCHRNSVDIQFANFIQKHRLNCSKSIKEKADFELKRSQARYEKTKELMHALKSSSIEVIALKGTAIGIGLLNNPHYKRMNDFDFLIKPEKVEKAIDAILSLGYQDTQALFGKPIHIEKDYHATPFFLPDGANILGLHWHLVSRKKKFKFDTAAIWNRSKPLTDNHWVRRLSWEDYLTHFAAHQDPYKFGIREVGDLALVIKNAKINEQKLHEYTRESCTEDELISVLSALHSFYPNTDLGFNLKKISTSLPFYRTLLVSQVEKQFALSRLSKTPEAKLFHWTQMWKLTIGASDWDLRALYRVQDTHPHFVHRLRAPFRCLKILAGDHGLILIGIVTAIHALQAFIFAILVFAKKMVGITSKNNENPILSRVNELE